MLLDLNDLENLRYFEEKLARAIDTLSKERVQKQIESIKNRSIEYLRAINKV